MRRKIVGVLGVFAVLLTGMTSAPSDPGTEKRGCCSHHHGVCGCQAGQTMCCDGTPSPTCDC